MSTRTQFSTKINQLLYNVPDVHAQRLCNLCIAMVFSLISSSAVHNFSQEASLLKLSQELTISFLCRAYQSSV